MESVRGRKEKHRARNLLGSHSKKHYKKFRDSGVLLISGNKTILSGDCLVSQLYLKSHCRDAQALADVQATSFFVLRSLTYDRRIIRQRLL